MRKKILFVAEGVTLAQVVRLVCLARCLDEDTYELHFASAIFDDLVFAGTSFARHRIDSVSPRSIQSALRAGRRLYGVRTLRRYVRADLALFDRVKPDLVVGDFRLSLPISAPVWGVRHVALANAYWSPFAVRRDFPLPDHPMVRLLGEERAARHFPTALPWVFRYFARPVNAVRRAYALPPIGSLPEVLTHGDHVLYADTPSLVPTAGAPPSHEYIGPVCWSPGGVDASLEAAIPASRPCVYVTLGSSGDVDVLPTVIEALAPLPVTVLVATAGRARALRAPSNVLIRDFVPGDWAARRAALVVSNGGSSTGYQALAEGTPVLGIASNLDQFLAMTAIADAGAGELVRASTVTRERVRAVAASLLDSPHHRERASVVKRDFASFSYCSGFRALIARLVGTPRGAAASSEATKSKGGGPLAPGMLAAAMLLALGGAAAAETPGRIPTANEIRFSTSVDGNQGHVICALFRKEGWLKAPVQWKKAAIRGGEAECVFAAVTPDVYGISAFHDENDNEKLDTNFLGIPKESWCTSRDAKGFFGPPSFDSAKFRYGGGVVRERVSMKYVAR